MMIIHQHRMCTALDKPTMRDNMTTSNTNDLPVCVDGSANEEENSTDYESKPLTMKSEDALRSSPQLKISVPKLSFLLSKKAATEQNEQSANDITGYSSGSAPDDEIYDTKNKYAPNNLKSTDSDGHDEDDAYDHAGQYATDDDGPLDLSLPSGHRRNPNLSDTDSEDSISIEDDKVPEKAAYKKNLIKRYRK